MAPILSIVLPAYNEEELIVKTLKDITSGLSKFEIGAEILVCENGSTDKTYNLVSKVATKNNLIRLFHQEEPSYGKALKFGIEKARAEKVIIFNVDFYDLDFVQKASELLNKFDFVIGSKNLSESKDLRPIVRRLITKFFNFFLKIVFQFEGTDTHGLKAFQKSKVEKILKECQTKGEIFDTELVLRAQKQGLKFTEIPVTVSEIRPSRYSLISRIPKTFSDIVSLAKALN